MAATREGARSAAASPGAGVIAAGSWYRACDGIELLHGFSMIRIVTSTVGETQRALAERKHQPDRHGDDQAASLKHESPHGAQNARRNAAAF